MTPVQFRRLVLSMPEASEGEHHGHPDFRLRGRIFASLHPDGRQGMVKVPPQEQQRLLRDHAGAFAPASGAWGRQGCTVVRLVAVDAATLRPAVVAAWQWAMEALPAQRKAQARRGGGKGRA